MIKGGKDSFNSTLDRASNAARRLPHAVVSGRSPEVFKQSLSDDTGIPALSWDAGLGQRFTNIRLRARAKRTE